MIINKEKKNILDMMEGKKTLNIFKLKSSYNKILRKTYIKKNENNKIKQNKFKKIKIEDKINKWKNINLKKDFYSLKKNQSSSNFIKNNIYPEHYISKNSNKLFYKNHKINNIKINKLNTYNSRIKLKQENDIIFKIKNNLY